MSLSIQEGPPNRRYPAKRVLLAGYPQNEDQSRSAEAVVQIEIGTKISYSCQVSCLNVLVHINCLLIFSLI